MVLIWNDNLKTGISIIDEQHQLLFETVGKFELVKKSKSNFYEVLINLQHYVSTHFITEEEYMRYSGYPDFANHKASHDAFLLEYKSILNKFDATESFLTLGNELMAFVETWLSEHYADADVRMASYIRAN